MKLSKAIQVFLGRKDMKPRSRKRFSSVLPHFEKFIGAETWLHEVTQARVSDYADGARFRSTKRRKDANAQQAVHPPMEGRGS